MLLESIILQSATQINQERTAANIYYLLTGRRSIQTIQDAYMYDIENFFGIYKKLPKQTFDKKVGELIRQGFLTENKNNENRIFLNPTEKSANWLRAYSSSFIFEYFNGMLYHERAPIFYQRLVLLIQTLTNTRENNFSFIPIIDERSTEKWVKAFYKRIKGNERDYLKSLYQEFEKIFIQLPSKAVNIFIDRLSGYNHYGMSIGQIAELYNKDENDIHLIIVAVVHKILQSMEKENKIYPTLSIVIGDYRHEIKLFGSTKQTYKLFKEKYQPEEIAQMRQLKLNTIYDHLTEIALHDRYFPFEQFISEDAQLEVLQAIRKTNSFKLKVIKENVSPSISFFQIRLMLILANKIKDGDAVYVQ